MGADGASVLPAIHVKDTCPLMENFIFVSVLNPA